MHSLTDEQIAEIEHELRVLKQVIGLILPYVAEQARKSEWKFSTAAKENDAHNVRLMQALYESLGEYPSSNFDVVRAYHCNACGHEFEIPTERDAGDYHKGPDIWYACPECNSSDHVKQEPRIFPRSD